MILWSLTTNSVWLAGMVAVVEKVLEAASNFCSGKTWPGKGAARMRSELAKACWSGNKFNGLMVSGRVTGWP